jgi:hypothetical protein
MSTILLSKVIGNFHWIYKKSLGISRAGLVASPRTSDLRQPEAGALRELQCTSGEELSALMPSILDKAFKGEL